MTKQTPTVSVVMTIYNNSDYLRPAMDSISNQTFTDFEFIIIDDGSKDDSKKIVEGYSDERIRFVSRANKGQSASLNEGINMARGIYIARQDADDISVADRFEKQVAFLNNHPEVGLLGTNYKEIDANSELIRFRNIFTRYDDLKLALVFSNQFAHGSVMMRKDVLDRVGLYDVNISSAQDYDLWTRISRVAEVRNLKETLFFWRYYTSGFSSGNPELNEQQAYKVRDREFELFLSNKGEYSLLSWHPFTTYEGPKKYMEMKSILYREMGLLYAYRGYRRYALPSMVLSILCAPWTKKPYHYLYVCIFHKSLIRSLSYDYI